MRLIGLVARMAEIGRMFSTEYQREKLKEGCRWDKKVKVPPNRFESPGGEGGGKAILYTLLISVLEGGGWSSPRPGRFLPPGKNRYPLYRMLLDGPQGGSGRVRKISPLPGFDPQTVQPVASRYTD
jgi:hypothetical protein